MILPDSVVAVDGDGVLQGGVTGSVAGVDYHIFFKLGGKLKMLFEKLTLSGVVTILAPAIRCGVVVVESGFTDGNATWVTGEWFQGGEVGVRSVCHITGVDADGGKNFRVLFRDVEIGGGVIEAGGEGDHTGDTVVAGADDDIAEFVGGELVGCQVAMGVGEHVE